ncbi:MAG: hypothetical protein R3C16_08025 [Hyphomonadaceae bacterium]
MIVNEDGVSRVTVIDAASGAHLGAGLSAPLGVINHASFTHDGAQLALSLNREAARKRPGSMTGIRAGIHTPVGRPSPSPRRSSPRQFASAIRAPPMERRVKFALMFCPKARTRSIPSW